MPDPLRRARVVGARRVSCSERSTRAITSDAPVAAGRSGLFNPFLPARRDCSRHPPREERTAGRNREAPSIDDGSHACVTQGRSELRSRDVSAIIRSSAPFHPSRLVRRICGSLGAFDELDPRPRQLATGSRFWRGPSTDASLDPAAVHRLLQLLYDAWAHPRRPDSHSFTPEFRSSSDAGARPHVPRPVLAGHGLPLTKKFHGESREPWQPFRRQPDGVARTPHDGPPEASTPP